MISYKVLSLSLLILCFVILSPVQAFTAKSLVIDVKDNTDAIITFDYELSWLEHLAVFAHIADPGTELKEALESNFHAPVEVLKADSGRSQFYVEEFASEQVSGGHTTLTTPPLSFREAEKVLKQYWFAPFINPDFSPDVSRVVFPDGYMQTFNNQDQIPRVSHKLGS